MAKSSTVVKTIRLDRTPVAVAYLASKVKIIRVVTEAAARLSSLASKLVAAQLVAHNS